MTNLWMKRRRRGAFAQAGGYSVGIVMLAEVGGLSTLNSCTSPEVMTPTAAVSPVLANIDFDGRVTRIVDGDTFWVNSQTASIRVWGKVPRKPISLGDRQRPVNSRA